MALNVTTSEAVYRAGSAKVPGDLALPVIDVTGASALSLPSFSDNGAGGTFTNVVNHGGGHWSATYNPKNRTRDGSHPRAPLVTITASDSATTGHVTIAVEATYPYNPHVGYAMPLDDDTKVTYARDGTPAFSEQDNVTRGWQLEFRNREVPELDEAENFWLYHRKTVLFWYYDLERSLLMKVRFDTGIMPTVDGADTYKYSFVVKGRINASMLADLLNYAGVGDSEGEGGGIGAP
jgi:hypothetical protein